MISLQSDCQKKHRDVKNGIKCSLRRNRRASEGSISLEEDKIVHSIDSYQNFWKRSFLSIQQERVTGAEKQLHKFLEASDKREETLKAYIRHLEVDLTKADQAKEFTKKQTNTILELQEKIQNMEKQLKTSEKNLYILTEELNDLKETKEDNLNLSKEISKQAAQLGHYKFITGTSFTAIEDGFVECCVTNHSMKSTTKFRLSKTEDRSRMKFTPLENFEQLPHFLQEEIEFKAEDCPELIQHILKGMFPETS